MNAWLPKCPSTHIQVGWDYRFISTVPMNFFLFLVSICTVVKEKSEILSYWKLGTYIRSGEVDICIAQWKDKLVLQVLARVKVTSGTRQAVNRAWCCLTSYFYTLEKIMCLFPGLYYEVNIYIGFHFIRFKIKSSGMRKFLKKWILKGLHCVKSVRIRSYSGPYFLAFGRNTER